MKRTWHFRWKQVIEDMIQPVWFFAGAACWGPKWLSLASVGIWIVRALLLRAIWRHDDAQAVPD
jgi:hypothetical protein